MRRMSNITSAFAYASVEVKYTQRVLSADWVKVRIWRYLER